MKEEKIVAINKAMAEFLKYSKVYMGCDGDRSCYQIGVDFVPVKKLTFHSSWDSLMKVIEGINATHKDGIVNRDLQYTINFLLSGGYGFTDYERKSLTMTKENLWLRASEFIDWYNKV